VTALLVRPKNRAADIGTGASCRFLQERWLLQGRS